MADEAQQPTVTEQADSDVTARLEAEVAELKDRLLRALADRENDRRRASRDREDAVRFAASGVVRDLLPAADSIRRAIDSVPEERVENALLDTILAGIEVTERMLLDGLARHGIRRVEPARGEKFNPDRHHAMTQVETADLPAGTVFELLQPGYVYHDRLLRPALVNVASAVAAPQAEGTTETDRRTDNG